MTKCSLIFLTSSSSSFSFSSLSSSSSSGYYSTHVFRAPSHCTGCVQYWSSNTLYIGDQNKNNVYTIWGPEILQEQCPWVSYTIILGVTKGCYWWTKVSRPSELKSCDVNSSLECCVNLVWMHTMSASTCTCRMTQDSFHLKLILMEYVCISFWASN